MMNMLQKISVLFLTVLFCAASVFAKPVNQNTAKQAALNFLESEISYVPAQPLTLVKSATGIYIFSNDNCFVIISADDAGDPILAYSTESGFKTDNVSPEVNYMLANYSHQINFIVKNQVPATSAISTRWNNLINNTLPEHKNAVYITPLLKTSWDQAPYYNDLCPYDNYYAQRTVTGCVATAMAQLMKYWNYPAQGQGYNSYADYNNLDNVDYGTLSVTFSNDTYDWTSMPTKLTASNTAVATLMYDCGIAVDMTYGVATTGGSGAQVIPYGGGGRSGSGQKCAETALINNFGYYSNTMKGLSRSSYPVDTVWMNLLETELSQRHPVIYSGFDSVQEGHCFVFDGYNTTHNLFHVNWGWSGIYNGYFSINNLNPGAGNIGAGIGSFNYDQQAILGIQPPPTTTSGIETSSGNSGNIKVYPNPATDHISVDLSGISGKTQQINILDIQGKLVYSLNPASDLNNVVINTSGISNGVYIMQAVSGNGLETARVVIAR